MHSTHGRRPRRARRRHGLFPASAPRARSRGLRLLLPALALLLLLLPALARAEAEGPPDAASVAPAPETGVSVPATTITRRLPAAPAAVPPPSNLLDLPAWLDYRDAAQAFACALKRDATDELHWMRRWGLFHVCADIPNPRFLIEQARHLGYRPVHNFARHWPAREG